MTKVYIVTKYVASTEVEGAVEPAVDKVFGTKQSAIDYVIQKYYNSPVYATASQELLDKRNDAAAFYVEAYEVLN